jgi:hypothetical protein
MRVITIVEDGIDGARKMVRTKLWRVYSSERGENGLEMGGQLRMMCPTRSSSATVASA